MRWFSYLGVAAFVGFAALFTWYLIMLARPVSLVAETAVEIPEQSGTEGVVLALYDAGVIRSRFAFVVHLFLLGKRAELKAGTYTFEGVVSLPTAIDVVTQQRSLQGEVQITLLEGWTNEEIASELAKHFSFSSEDFLNEAESTSATTYDFLQERPAQASLQGFLFPDTYRLFVDAQPADIIETMLENFDRRFTRDMRDQLKQQGRSLYDAVILASIVEKEARTSEDMAIAAGIFWKRLDAGMRLESDATINYITKKNDPTPSAVDLGVESAYNTYRNSGLPPAPIGNPGLDALQAVITSTATPYWYFLTTPDGEMVYSETYDEHLEEKATYYP